MYKTRLYGIDVESDLYLQRPPAAAATCRYTPHASHISLSLVGASPAALPIPGSVAIPYQNAHGRTATIHVDRLSEKILMGQAWAFEVEDVVCFHGTGGSRMIAYTAAEGTAPEQVAFWFMHTLLPFYLAAEHAYWFVHAAAAEVNGKAMVFMARSGGGKSTLLDYFLKRGCPLISDDKLAILHLDGTYLAVPSHARHRPYRKQEDLGFVAETFSSEPVPIQGIYILEAGDAGCEVIVSEVVGLEKLQRLFPASLFGLKVRQAELLEELGKAANQISMFVLQVPWDKGRLADVYTLLQARL